MPVEQILAGAPVATIDEAIAIMQAIDRTLPDADGVKWFNRLYLRVTVSVGAAVRASHFSDPGFLAKLDVSSPICTSRRSPPVWLTPRPRHRRGSRSSSPG